MSEIPSVDSVIETASLYLRDVGVLGGVCANAIAGVAVAIWIDDIGLSEEAGIAAARADLARLTAGDLVTPVRTVEELLDAARWAAGRMTPFGNRGALRLAAQLIKGAQ